MVKMKCMCLYFTICLALCVSGGDYSIWLCARRIEDIWHWECGLEVGKEIWETYDGFSKDVDIYAPSKDTLVMDDQMDFQYNVLEPTIRLHRIMCEVSHITMGSFVGRENQYIQLVKVLYCKMPTIGVMGDCPSGWGRLLPGATYCWQLMFHSSGYTWEEAEHTCRHSVMPEGTPHLCAISSEAEYVAIKNWLSSYLPNPPDSTQYATTIILEETTSETIIMEATKSTAFSTNTLPVSSETTPQVVDTTQNNRMTTTANPQYAATTTKNQRSTFSTEKPCSSTHILFVNNMTTPNMSETTPHSDELVTSYESDDNVTEIRPLRSFYIDNSQVPEGIEHLDPDKRAFAIGMGVLAILLMVGFGVFVCMMDLPVFVRDFKKFRRNIRYFLKSKKIKGLNMC